MACCFNSRFRRKLSGTTGHRLLGTQRPQMLYVEHGSGSVYLQSLWELRAKRCIRFEVVNTGEAVPPPVSFGIGMYV